MAAAKGEAAAKQLMEQLEREWQQLKSIRQRYASAPAAPSQGRHSAESVQTPTRSILKRRSMGALQETVNQLRFCEVPASSGP